MKAAIHVVYVFSSFICVSLLCVCLCVRYRLYFLFYLFDRSLALNYHRLFDDTFSSFTSLWWKNSKKIVNIRNYGQKKYDFYQNEPTFLDT